MILYEFRSEDIAIIEKLTELLLTKSLYLYSDEAILNLKMPLNGLVAMILEVGTQSGHSDRY